MGRWKTFIDSNNSIDIFTTMVSQMGRVFEIVIEANVLYKNLQKNNKKFLNKTSQKEETKKAKANTEAIKNNKLMNL